MGQDAGLDLGLALFVQARRRERGAASSSQGDCEVSRGFQDLAENSTSANQQYKTPVSKKSRTQQRAFHVLALPELRLLTAS